MFAGHDCTKCLSIMDLKPGKQRENIHIHRSKYFNTFTLLQWNIPLCLTTHVYTSHATWANTQPKTIAATVFLVLGTSITTY